MDEPEPRKAEALGNPWLDRKKRKETTEDEVQIESMSNTRFEEIMKDMESRVPRMSEFIHNQKELIFSESPNTSNGKEQNKEPLDFGDGSEVVP